MIASAETLAGERDFARIGLYMLNDTKIVFGEITLAMGGMGALHACRTGLQARRDVGMTGAQHPYPPFASDENAIGDGLAVRLL